MCEKQLHNKICHGTDAQGLTGKHCTETKSKLESQYDVTLIQQM